jgi:hypothetical protein
VWLPHHSTKQCEVHNTLHVINSVDMMCYSHGPGEYNILCFTIPIGDFYNFRLSTPEPCSISVHEVLLRLA